MDVWSALIFQASVESQNSSSTSAWPDAQFEFSAKNDWPTAQFEYSSSDECPATQFDFTTSIKPFKF
jgi:hypothetical protein